MKFTKMEGLGNDFVVLDGPLQLDRQLIANLCDRRSGIGADGILIVTPLSTDRVRMEYFNADGGPAEMCGNGLRCVARRAADLELVTDSTFVVETPIGPRSVSTLGDGLVRVELGPIEAAPSDDLVDGHRLRTVSVGNPHAVIFVDDPKLIEVERIGSELEENPFFPDGTNVEFVSVMSDELIDMRVWERGVGETLACGTGAAAVVAAAAAEGRSKTTATVRLLKGSLQVEIIEGTAWITGPATTVYFGEWINQSSASERI